MGHIKDSEFIRDKVPMTKAEVRAISVAKLDLKEDSILLDIGAGSGSVGIEAATYLKSGRVYGIEINPLAVELIGKNLESLNIENYTLIDGMAPMALPTIKCDRMFIGGSKGNLNEIIEYFIENSNLGGKVVINAIALETLEMARKVLESKNFKDIEIVSVNIARNKKIGSVNMMMGENPIYVISGTKGE